MATALLFIRRLESLIFVILHPQEAREGLRKLDAQQLQLGAQIRETLGADASAGKRAAAGRAAGAVKHSSYAADYSDEKELAEEEPGAVAEEEEDYHAPADVPSMAAPYRPAAAGAIPAAHASYLQARISSLHARGCCRASASVCAATRGRAWRLLSPLCVRGIARSLQL